MRTKAFEFLVRCALATLVCIPVVSQAQTVTGAITGEITDSSGAAIPKAQVTVQNVDTGVQTRAETNEAGVYSIRFLPIGHYRVVVEAQGFSPRSVPDFTLEINQTVKLNEKLAVGSTTTAVVVNSDAPILNTNDGTLGVTISSNEIS